MNLLPGWETKRLLGEGSYGCVYEIERSAFQYTEKAALKVISIPHWMSEINAYRMEGYDDAAIRRIFRERLAEVSREYTLMAEMKDCPYIVRCEDFREMPHADGIGVDALIRMELLTPLTEYLPPELPEETAWKLFADLSRALCECEKRHVLHRDIKPQNVFVSQNGTFKLGDFGIAKAAEGTMGGTRAGTYKFMAPEVFMNKPYGARADIYSLGLMMYWLLNERREPFLPPDRVPSAEEEEAARQRRFSGEPLPPPKNGSAALKRIVCRACEADPERRFPDADALLQALERKDCGSLEERGALEQGKSGTTRRRVLFSCAAVLTAALLLFVGRGVWKEKPAAPVQRETAAPTAEVRGSEELRILNETDPDGNVVIALTMEKALQVSTSQPDAELRWSSEDTSVASVDPSGVVTGVSPGTTIITVSCGSASASVPVKVALRDTYTLENLTEKERAFFLNYCNSIISYADASERRYEIRRFDENALAYFEEGKLYKLEATQTHHDSDFRYISTYYYDPDTAEVVFYKWWDEEDDEWECGYYYEGFLFQAVDSYSGVYETRYYRWDALEGAYESGCEYGQKVISQYEPT